MQVRLLPVLIVAAGLAFTVKVNGIWQGLDAIVLSASADAEEAAPAAAAQPAEDAKSAPSAEGTAAPSGELSSDKSGGQPEAAARDVSDGTAPDERGRDETAAIRPTDPLDLSDEEIVLLQQLGQRRKEIEQRAREIEQRAALLEAAEQRIDDKVEELKQLQAAIQEMLVQHSEQEEDQLRSLVKIYENMKPKDAARIFEQLDMLVLLEVVDRMNERRVAPILAKMNPSKAQEVTLELAQRRELPIAKD